MTGKSVLLVPVFLTLFLGFLFFRASALHSEPGLDPCDRIRVFVSILPQAYFVERVGGDRVDVSVMVGPGQSPATYEPTPKQMAELGKAKLYFRIGVPFENVWMGRICKANRNIKVIDTRRGIELLPMKAHRHHDENEIPGHHAKFKRDPEHDEDGGHDHGKGMKDPHIWLSLRLVKIQAQNIYNALIAEDPAHMAYYQDNLRGFHNDLEKLDAKTTGILKGLKTRRFLVFHPAWGYFARDYRLEEMPIELEGKQPSAKTLAHLIEQAKRLGIRVVFVQQQFSEASAEAVARAIGGKVVKVDPLAKDYLNNMRKIAETFAEVMQ